MTKTMLETPTTTQNGKYIIDGMHTTNDNGDGFFLVRNVGWVQYSNKLCAVLIPHVGWVTY